MPKTLTLRIDDKTYRTFVKRAKAENRSIANFIEHTVKKHLQEHDFVDDAEMAGIVENDQLVDRLRRGSKDAQKKKGALIG
jgi:hypothetical protein